jgi:shikimate dehydrogenase
MKKFAVIGKPIKHSLSPRIHREFAKEAGIEISYEAIEVDPKSFTSQTNKLFKEGYEGLNVTLPLKGLAYNFADKVSELGNQTKAVNTLWKEGKNICADSTDGLGLVRDLANNKISLEQCNIIILGAGGAAQSIVPSLLRMKPNKVFVINRTFDKSLDLINKFKNSKVELKAVKEKEIPREGIQGIINATSFGVDGGSFEFNKDLFEGINWVYDLNYSDRPTAFCEIANEYGIRICLDGLGMLVNQAAASFEIWTGIKPAPLRALKLIKDSF